jgi:UDP-N-acetylglucosamine 2-epimerase (non-hydrolysing)
MSKIISLDQIIETGNTVIDSLQYASKKVDTFSDLVKDERLRKIYASGKKILLITGHRRENFGQGLINICDAIKTLAEKYSDLYFVYPVHLNPNVQKPVYERLEKLSNVHLTAPLNYPDFVYAMKNSWAILTDSGGVQEEAPGLGKPVLVMRDTTERPEAVEAGTVKLVGAKRDNIIDGVSKLVESPSLYAEMGKAHNPYGDGKAVERIIDFLINNKVIT